MCGRFVQKVDRQTLETRYDIPVPAEARFRPRFNLAPGQPAVVITSSHDGPRLESCMWGLIPAWTKAIRPGAGLINARAETVWQKPSFRNPMRYRRCLVPANGFYEWQRLPGAGAKQPFFFTLREASIFSFAGLWDIWNDDDGGELFTFAIITRPANAAMRPYHDRMPLILNQAGEGAWLDSGLHEPDALASVLRGGDVPLDAVPVSARVNRVSNDDARCIEPWDGSAELKSVPMHNDLFEPDALA